MRGSGWYEGREIARARFIIAKIVGRSEVVRDFCRRSHVETRHLAQRGEKRRSTRRPRTELLTATIYAITRQIRFTVGIPRQDCAPRAIRPQHTKTCDHSDPVHAKTPFALIGSKRTIPIDANYSRARTYLGLPNWLGRPRSELRSERISFYSGNYARCVP